MSTPAPKGAPRKRPVPPSPDFHSAGELMFQADEYIAVDSAHSLAASTLVIAQLMHRSVLALEGIRAQLERDAKERADARAERMPPNDRPNPS